MPIRTLKLALGPISALILTLCAAPVSARPSFTVAEAEAGSCWDYRSMERRVARAINRKRVARDIGKLALDKHVSHVSRHHTNEMIDDRALEHTPLPTLAGRVTNWIELGENIGRSSNGMRPIMKAMMRSPLHRANILNGTFAYFGVGTRRRAGSLWMTITFETRDDPGTTLSMPRC